MRNLQEEQEGELEFWVDALCINQNNPNEKSHQVPLMGKIFSRAHCVLIWMSDMPSSVGVAYETLYLMQEVNKSTQRLIETQNGQEGPEATYSSLKKVDDPFWPAIFTFMHHEWFRRIWTYQEIYLAEEASVLLEDGRLIEWGAVRVCRKALLNGNMRKLLGIGHYQALKLTLGYDPITPLLDVQQFRLTGPDFPATELGYLLVVLCNRKATKHKDHIYGLLGLLNESERASITVDYSISDAFVFAQALKVSINSWPEWLTIIWERYRTTQPVIEGLPSWCPDFSVTTAGSFPGRCWHSLGVELKLKYKAFARVEDHGDLGILGVVGMRLDRIEFCAPKGPRLEFSDYALTMVSLHSDHVAWSNLTQYFDHCFGQQERTWLMSFSNASRDHGMTPREWSEGLSSLEWPEASEQLGSAQKILAVLTFCEILEAYEHIESMTASAVAERSRLGWREQCELLITMWTLLWTFSETYIFQTRTGKLGTSERLVHPGDNVVYVPGAIVLTVLSPNCDRYVGCATVKGLSEEALPRSPEEVGDRWETFWLS